jgi:hypothetical protein
MKLASVGFALLLSSLTLGAQDRNGPTVQTFPEPVQIISQACPVGMQAQQRGSSQLVAVHNGQRVQTTGQRITLTLRGASSPRIITGRVKVRGFTPKGHVLQSKAGGNLATDITRAMSVVFDEVSNGGVTGELVLPGFTSVASIELEEITYENGTVWKSERQSVCRVAPDMFMLISDR